MSSWSVIVYGPQGSGKTQNIELMKRHFNLTRTADGDVPGREDFPLRDTLILANVRPSLSFTKTYRHIQVYTVDQVRSRLGPQWQ